PLAPAAGPRGSAHRASEPAAEHRACPARKPEAEPWPGGVRSPKQHRKVARGAAPRGPARACASAGVDDVADRLYQLRALVLRAVDAPVDRPGTQGGRVRGGLDEHGVVTGEPAVALLPGEHDGHAVVQLG